MHINFPYLNFRSNVDEFHKLLIKFEWAQKTFASFKMQLTIFLQEADSFLYSPRLSVEIIYCHERRITSEHGWKRPVVYGNIFSTMPLLRRNMKSKYCKLLNWRAKTVITFEEFYKNFSDIHFLEEQLNQKQIFVIKFYRCTCW